MSESSAAVKHVRQAQIQALRALAVGSVVLYHFWPYRIPGGYTGVDVFFVISGFLMTNTLLTFRLRSMSFRNGTREFYSRRFRRILPAALVTLLLVSITVLLFTTRIDWLANFRETLASALFFENWKLAAQSSNYLAEATGASAVQHYWSLSVEEQFYLVWPAIVWLATRSDRGRKLRFPAWGTFLGLTVASLAYCVYETNANPAAAYFNTGARIWEFSVGAMVCVLARNVAVNRQLGAALGWIGLPILAFAFFRFSADTVFPGWHALIPVVGTACLILCTEGSAPWGPYRVLAIKPLQWIGDLSYSLYLTHWSVLILATDIHGTALSGREKVELLPLVVLSAMLLKAAVENQFRVSMPGSKSRNGWFSRPVYALSGGAICLLLVLTASVYGVTTTNHEVNQASVRLEAFSKTVPSCYGAETLEPSRCMPSIAVASGVVPSPLVAARDFPYGDCQQSFAASSIKSCHYGSPTGVKAVVIGDSHMTQWLPAVMPWLVAHGYSVTTFLKSACGFSLDAPVLSCARWSLAVEHASRALDPHVVIASVESTPGSISESKLVASAFESLTEQGATLVGIHDNPQPDLAGVTNVPDCLLRNPQARSQCAFPELPAVRDDVISHVVTQVPGAKVINMDSMFCPTQECPPVIGGVLVYLDGGHITGTYAASLARPMAHQLRSAVG